MANIMRFGGGGAGNNFIGLKRLEYLNPTNRITSNTNYYYYNTHTGTAGQFAYFDDNITLSKAYKADDVVIEICFGSGGSIYCYNGAFVISTNSWSDYTSSSDTKIVSVSYNENTGVITIRSRIYDNTSMLYVRVSEINVYDVSNAKSVQLIERQSSSSNPITISTVNPEKTFILFYANSTNSEKGTRVTISNSTTLLVFGGSLNRVLYCGAIIEFK